MPTPAPSSTLPDLLTFLHELYSAYLAGKDLTVAGNVWKVPDLGAEAPQSFQHFLSFSRAYFLANPIVTFTPEGRSWKLTLGDGRAFMLLPAQPDDPRPLDYVLPVTGAMA